jgi:hypothetical protein
MVWKLGHLQRPKSREEAEFLALPFEVIFCSEGRQILRKYVRMSIRHADKESMACFCAAHVELVQAEFDLYADLVVKRATTTGGASISVISPSPPVGPSTSASA